MTPAVLAGGDLYRIHSFSAFHIPPRCCQDDGLNHLCAEGGGRGAEPGQSRQGQSFQVDCQLCLLELAEGTFAVAPSPLGCLLPQMP